MNYTYDELNPPGVILRLPLGEVQLSKLTLEIQAQYEETYKGLDKIFDLLKTKPLTLIEALWFLVKDKSRFGFNYQNFYKFFTSKDIKGSSQIGYEALVGSIARSQPLIKNQKRYNELAKIKKAQSDDQSTVTCYGEIFDKFSSRYSMTIDDFYNLTLRQVHILLQKMDDGKHKELEVQAALLGKKLQPRMIYADISEEQEADNEAQAQEALKRLQEQYKQKQQAKG